MYDIGSDRAIVKASIIDLGAGIQDHGICYSNTPNPTVEDMSLSFGKTNVAGEYSCLMENLDDNQTYFVRAFIASIDQVIYGDEKSFTTLRKEYIISEWELKEITAISAKFSGSLSPDGAEQLKELGIVINKSETVSLNNYSRREAIEYRNDLYEVELFNLEPSTTYYSRVYGLTDQDSLYSGIIEFTTMNGIVIFNATIINSLTHNSVVCFPSISSDGGSSIYQRGICWSESELPTTYGDFKLCGLGTGDFECSITGLKPDNTYYLRAFATNGIDTYYEEPQIEIHTEAN